MEVLKAQPKDDHGRPCAWKVIQSVPHTCNIVGDARVPCERAISHSLTNLILYSSRLIDS